MLEEELSGQVLSDGSEHAAAVYASQWVNIQDVSRQTGSLAFLYESLSRMVVQHILGDMSSDADVFALLAVHDYFADDTWQVSNGSLGVFRPQWRSNK